MSDRKIDIIIKADDLATKELKKVQKEVKKLDTNFQKAWKAARKVWDSVKANFKKIAIWAWIAWAAVTTVWKQFLDLWTNIEQTQKKAAVVFWDYISDVEEFADRTAASMWLSKNEYIWAAAWLQDLLIPMWFAREEATKMTTDTIALSWALAEWSNGQYTAAEASEILAKAFLWETEQLKSMWISISTWSDEFKALQTSIQETTWSTLEQSRALAIQQLILAKSTDAQTAFKEWAWSLARQQAEMTAALKDSRDVLATALIPAFNELLKTLQPVIADITTSITLWAENKDNIDSLKSSIVSIIEFFKILWNIISFVVKTLHTLWKAIGFVVADIVIKISSLIPLFTNVWDTIIAVWTSVKDWTVEVFNFISDYVNWVVDSITETFTAAFNKIKWIFDKIVAFKEKISWAISSAATSVTTTISGARADGWPVQSWKTFLVWERWPELFTPNTSWNITSNEDLTGWGWSVTINMWWVVVNNDADENRLVEKIKRSLTIEARNYNLWIT